LLQNVYSINVLKWNIMYSIVTRCEVHCLYVYKYNYINHKPQVDLVYKTSSMFYLTPQLYNNTYNKVM